MNEDSRMNETKPNGTAPKKIVSRNVVIALGIICIILGVSLVGTFAYYVPVMNDQNNKINSLNSQLASLQGDYSDFARLEKSEVLIDNATVTGQTNGLYELIDGFDPLWSGYLLVNLTSTSSSSSIEVGWNLRGYWFGQERTITGQNGIAVFAVANAPSASTTNMFIRFLGSVYYIRNETATVTVTFYY